MHLKFALPIKSGAPSVMPKKNKVQVVLGFINYLESFFFYRFELKKKRRVTEKS